MNQPPSTRLRSGAVETVLATTLVTDATRSALRARLEWRRSGPSVLTDAALTTLRAVCDRLIPQSFDRCVDLADRLDASLADGAGDGWRFDELPADRQAIQIGLSGIEQSARAMFGQAFPDLSPEHRDAVLMKVQNGSAPGTIWETLPAKRLFEELLGQLATLYYAESVAQEAIGYIGMADAEGFKSIGLNRRDAIEHKASHAPL